MNNDSDERVAWSLWIPVTIAFVLLIAAWATIIFIASKNPTERIEIEETEVQP